MADIYRWAIATFPSGVKRWGPLGRGNGFGATGSGIPAGMYEARVSRFGQVTFGNRFGTSPSLRYPQQTLEIDDSDKVFSNILGSGEQIEQSPITVGKAYVANGAIVASRSNTGVLTSWSDADAEMRRSLVIEKDSTAYEREIGYPLRRQDFPSMPIQALRKKLKGAKKSTHHSVTTEPQPPDGIMAPIIYGLHDSAGIGNVGACPVIHVVVDSTSSVFYGLVAWGRVTILRVYKNGVRLTSAQFPAAATNVAYPVIGGHLYTVLTFSTDQSANEWAVDVQGYDSVGDGTGTALNAPGECMLHFIRNVACLGTTPPVRGIWNTSGGDVSASDFTLAGLAKRAGGHGYKCSAYIDDTTTLASELNGWGQTFQLYPYISPAGPVGVMFNDPSLAALTWSDGDRWLRHKTAHDFEELGQPYDEDTVSKVIVTPNALATGGNPTTPLTVYNPMSKSKKSESISMAWGLCAQ